METQSSTSVAKATSGEDTCRRKKQRVAVNKYEEALAKYKLQKEELNEDHAKAAELVEPLSPPESAIRSHHADKGIV